MLCLYHIVDLTNFSNIALILEVMSNKDHAMESPDNVIKGLKVFIEESIKIQDLVLKSRMDENGWTPLRAPGRRGPCPQQENETGLV
jgi:hypothetical protein